MTTGQAHSVLALAAPQLRGDGTVIAEDLLGPLPPVQGGPVDDVLEVRFEDVGKRGVLLPLAELVLPMAGKCASCAEERRPDRPAPRCCHPDWGMGHATRTWPLILAARQLGAEVTIATRGTAAAWIEARMAEWDRNTRKLRRPGGASTSQGVTIRYGAGRDTRFRIAAQLPGYLVATSRERRWCGRPSHSRASPTCSATTAARHRRRRFQRSPLPPAPAAGAAGPSTAGPMAGPQVGACLLGRLGAGPARLPAREPTVPTVSEPTEFVGPLGRFWGRSSPPHPARRSGAPRARQWARTSTVKA